MSSRRLRLRGRAGEDDDPRFFDRVVSGDDDNGEIVVYALPLDPTIFRDDDENDVRSSSSSRDPSSSSLIPWRSRARRLEGRSEITDGKEGEERVLVDRFDARLLLAADAAASSSAAAASSAAAPLPSSASDARDLVEAAVLRSAEDAAAERESKGLPEDDGEGGEEVLDRIRYEFLRGHRFFRRDADDGRDGDGRGGGGDVPEAEGSQRGRGAEIAPPPPPCPSSLEPFVPWFSPPENVALPSTLRLHRIVARTALFVRRAAGLRTELALRAAHGSNPAFASFLEPGGSLRAYYEWWRDGCGGKGDLPLLPPGREEEDEEEEDKEEEDEEEEAEEEEAEEEEAEKEKEGDDEDKEGATLVLPGIVGYESSPDPDPDGDREREEEEDDGEGERRGEEEKQRTPPGPAPRPPSQAPPPSPRSHPAAPSFVSVPINPPLVPKAAAAVARKAERAREAVARAAAEAEAKRLRSEAEAAEATRRASLEAAEAEERRKREAAEAEERRKREAAAAAVRAHRRALLVVDDEGREGEGEGRRATSTTATAADGSQCRPSGKRARGGPSPSSPFLPAPLPSDVEGRDIEEDEEEEEEEGEIDEEEGGGSKRGGVGAAGAAGAGGETDAAAAVVETAPGSSQVVPHPRLVAAVRAMLERGD